MSVQKPSTEAAIARPGTDGTEQTPDQPAFALPANANDLVWFHDRTLRTVSLEGSGYRNRCSYSGFLHPEYTVRNASRRTKADAFESWLNMEFPRIWGDLHGLDSPRTHGPNSLSQHTVSGPDGRAYANFSVRAWHQFLQHPDGSGYVLAWASDPAWVRTKSGLVLEATEDQKRISGNWWFASYVHPPGKGWFGTSGDADYGVPLQNIQEMDGTPPLVGIVDVADGGGHQYVRFDDGTTAVVLADTSANGRDNTHAAFLTETDSLQELPPVEEAETLIMPDRVRQMYLNGWEIITSDEYRAGWNSGSNPGTWQHEATGNCIVRQGEWYLVPKPADWMPDEPIKKCLPVPNRKHDYVLDHLTERSPIDISDGDVECGCGSTRWNLHERLPLWRCKECDDQYVYTMGDTLYHTLHECPSVDQRQQDLGSHNPRDLSLDAEGRTVVRGTFRHVENEHAMLNVGERWHEVHENTADMTVFSMRRGRYASGGSGSGMRYE